MCLGIQPIGSGENAFFLHRNAAWPNDGPKNRGMRQCSFSYKMIEKDSTNAT
jgi:hypothetical protein